ncbi:unnamed protein product [Mycetohabitans rhizoxinica HKI 454]|uniref:Uncharacterized protein n=1 Tax=Mycetohabitans rhizoxinica (strain DSM 19002 / CIP 109453 / HKI 454) TaxID=882378 RepID=E5APY8_MYCRK|nr:unnamed protein product [Mycetohabitans rhizoxinica HKI 454]
MHNSPFDAPGMASCELTVDTANSERDRFLARSSAAGKACVAAWTPCCCRRTMGGVYAFLSVPTRVASITHADVDSGEPALAADAWAARRSPCDRHGDRAAVSSPRRHARLRGLANIALEGAPPHATARNLPRATRAASAPLAGRAGADGCTSVLLQRDFFHLCDIRRAARSPNRYARVRSGIRRLSDRRRRDARRGRR